VQITLVK